jgi:hypothetical protein
MPKYIMGKDFHKHVGKKILMPHPTDPNVMPIELKIVKADNKQVTLEMVGMDCRKTDNYSKDKNKYLLID